MRKFLALSALLLIFSATGCAFQFNVPDVNVALDPPENPVKFPLRAAVLIPDENYMMTKTFNIADFSYTFTIPFGQYIKKSSLSILPHYFDKVDIVKDKTGTDSADVLFVPTINDFGFDSAIEGFSTQKVKSRVFLKTNLTDIRGEAIWDKTTNSPWVTKSYQGISTDEWIKNYGMATLEATAVAMKDAVRGMAMSMVFKDYIAAKKNKGIITSEASQELTTKSIPLRPDTYAVVIGIDYKERRDIPNLQYASQDARNIYGILTDPRYGGVPKENAVLLLNEKATRNEMVTALRKIKTWDGYIYVYYSGHGAPKTKGDKFMDAYLVPSDAAITDPEALDETAIKLSYLQELVEASNAKGVLLALDSCFSGGGKSIVPKGGKPLVGMIVSPDFIKPKGAGKVVITSSATNQQSWEDESELKGGIFSHYLSEGLKGKAGKDVWVKVDELADYIKENVPKAARKLKGAEQTPHISGKGDFAITRNWDRAKVVDVEITRAKLKDAFEKGIITAAQLSKAMDEMKSQKKSKTLEAFLEGKIDDKKFGELY